MHILIRGDFKNTDTSTVFVCSKVWRSIGLLKTVARRLKDKVIYRYTLLSNVSHKVAQAGAELLASQYHAPIVWKPFGAR